MSKFGKELIASMEQAAMHAMGRGQSGVRVTKVALEHAGIAFLDDEAGGIGVRLLKKKR